MIIAKITFLNDLTIIIYGFVKFGHIWKTENLGEILFLKCKVLKKTAIFWILLHWTSLTFETTQHGIFRNPFNV